MAPPVDPLPDQHSIEHALARYVEENSFLEQVNKFEIQLVRSEQLAYESNTGCQLKFSSIADRHVQAISSRDIMVQIINGRKHARQGTEPTVETILESQREDLHVSAVDAGVARLEDLITAWKEIPSKDFFKTKRQASCRFKDSAAAFRQRSKAFLDDQRERILTVSGVPATVNSVNIADNLDKQHTIFDQEFAMAKETFKNFDTEAKELVSKLYKVVASMVEALDRMEKVLVQYSI
ncbi:hypothetical protein IWZ01DRAFT_544879 [Phyllosticta capitalensis]